MTEVLFHVQAQPIQRPLFRWAKFFQTDLIHNFGEKINDKAGTAILQLKLQCRRRFWPKTGCMAARSKEKLRLTSF